MKPATIFWIIVITYIVIAAGLLAYLLLPAIRPLLDMMGIALGSMALIMVSVLYLYRKR